MNRAHAMDLRIQPRTIIVRPNHSRTSVDCTDEQAIEWHIIATEDGKEKTILIAFAQAIAELTVDMLETAGERS